MNVKNFLETTPESLAEEQWKVLTEAVTERLREIAILIEEGCYDHVDNMLCESRSGDAHGDDNYFIDFSDIYGEDIHDVVRKLKDLRSQFNIVDGDDGDF